MAISTETDPSGKKVIKVSGRFDFSVHQEFRNTYTADTKGDHQYVVDMNGAEYMDSSALGMLLQLRDHAGGGNQSVSIVNCSNEIREIFRISNFNKLFDIQE